ncbi:hypothetical protein ACNJUF_21295, partial [Mycobacterium tuberculosis]
MRSIARFFAAVMRAALAAMTAAPRLIWDGVRWIARSMSGAPGQAAAAQAEAVAEMQAAAAEAEQD